MRYAIIQTRHFYGPEDRRSLVATDDGAAITFATAPAARTYIRERLEVGRYYQAHNEYGVPDYQVQRTDLLPEYLRHEL